MAWIQERKTKDGKTRYRAVIRIRGAKTECATFPNKTKALLWAKSIEAAIAEGRYFQLSESKKHTLKELIELYEVKYKKKIAKSKQLAQLAWWKEQLGHELLSAITPSIIADYRDKLLNGITVRGEVRSEGTVVRYLAVLSHVCTMAVREKGWMNENPVLKVEKPTEPRGRVRFLSPEERERLLKACQESKNQYLYPIVVLALSTGMRKSEFMNLHWTSVDFDRKRITLHETKNGDIRAVPLVGLAYDLIKGLYESRKGLSPFLFPSDTAPMLKPCDIRSAWEFALKKADIQDFTLHSCRHSCASELAMSGSTLAEIGAVLGHKTLAMVKRYSHLGEAHTLNVVERMNAKIFG